jgi:DNA-binding NtrC family response regulator
MDRVHRYRDVLALIAWSLESPQRASGLLASVLRRCDAAGMAPDGTLIGVFPGLDDTAATEVAERALSLLRAASPHARAGVAVFPSDGIDAAALLLAARDALAATTDVGRPDRATRRVEIGNDTAIVGDPGMVRTYDLLRRLAAGDLTVLVTGETGVGKELAARALHAWSPRARGPFVVVNCAALPEQLVESQLFGHRRGAFSGADRDAGGFFDAAGGGTLFLDEVGELSLATQAKLLRAVDTRMITPVGATQTIPIDLRIVTATNRDLAAEVAASRFREDLWYRLSAAVVVLPPLRDRTREIPTLARAFVERACRRMSRAPLHISDAAMQDIMGRRYPGNVRELANTIEYAVTIADEDTLEPWHLPPEPSRNPATAERSSAFRPIADEVEDLERRRMTEALAACKGNQSKAADLIGMPRRTFVTKLNRYGLR